jgi:hypothetical protein
MAKLSPPYTETVQKYCKDTGEDLSAVQAKISAFAEKLRTKNLDVAAWAWVQSTGKAPPALKADSMPFVVNDKPYWPIFDALKADSGLGENVGFNLRGYVFGSREWTSKDNKPGLALTIGDESGVSDVAYFGKQVEAIRGMDLQTLDSIFVSQAQLSKNPKNQQMGIRCTGNYSETKRIAPSEKNLGPVTSITPTPINTIAVYQSAFIRGLAFDQKPFSYMGCPRCMSKFKENVPAGRQGECPGNPEKHRPSCGVVISTKHTWATIRVNDDEGEIACKFSPDFELEEEKAKLLLNRYLFVVGTLSDKGDFNVLWFLPEDEAGKLTPTEPAPTAIPVMTNPVIVSTGGSTQTSVTVTNPQPLSPTPVPAQGTNPAIGPVLLRWLKLFTPAPEDAIIKFAATKGVGADETKAAIAEMIDLGALAREPTGKIRLA